MDYDPAKVVITHCGVPLTGFAPGSFVKIDPAADGWKKQVGADGCVSRAKVNNTTADVKVILSQTSMSNTVLSARYETDRKTHKGKGPLLVKDLLGATLFYAPIAWIKKMASVDLGEEIGAKEWSFDTGKSNLVNGGNNVL